jgi:hypothetical protein
VCGRPALWELTLEIANGEAKPPRSDGCFTGGQLAKIYEDFINGKNW